MAKGERTLNADVEAGIPIPVRPLAPFLLLIMSLNHAGSPCTVDIRLGWVFNFCDLEVMEPAGTKGEKGQGTAHTRVKPAAFT